LLKDPTNPRIRDEDVETAFEVFRKTKREYMLEKLGES